MSSEGWAAFAFVLGILLFPIVVGRLCCRLLRDNEHNETAFRPAGAGPRDRVRFLIPQGLLVAAIQWGAFCAWLWRPLQEQPVATEAFLCVVGILLLAGVAWVTPLCRRRGVDRKAALFMQAVGALFPIAAIAVIPLTVNSIGAFGRPLNEFRVTCADIVVAEVVSLVVLYSGWRIIVGAGWLQRQKEKPAASVQRRD